MKVSKHLPYWGGVYGHPFSDPRGDVCDSPVVYKGLRTTVALWVSLAAGIKGFLCFGKTEEPGNVRPQLFLPACLRRLPWESKIDFAPCQQEPAQVQPEEMTLPLGKLCDEQQGGLEPSTSFPFFLGNVSGCITKARPATWFMFRMTGEGGRARGQQAFLAEASRNDGSFTTPLQSCRSSKLRPPCKVAAGVGGVNGCLGSLWRLSAAQNRHQKGAVQSCRPSAAHLVTSWIAQAGKRNTACLFTLWFSR